MARWTEQHRKPVDDLVGVWRAACLIDDGSLRGTGAVWTPENIASLMTAFVENPLEDDSKFIEKLELQIKNEPPDAIRLMAEIIAIYQAFAVNAVGTDRKRELINEVLAFCGDQLEPSGVVWEGMAGGIGGPGQGFNSFRPYLLMYLIRFAAALKKLDQPGRAALLEGAEEQTPWDFKRWLDEHLPEPKEGAQTMRNILLHLLFPDSFERIAVDEDKAQVVARLGGIAEGLDADNDVALFQIRRRLEDLLPGGTEGGDGQTDFYYSPLLEAWDPEDSRRGRRSVRHQSHLTALEFKKQVVLYGPPGTGKTYEAKQLAEQLIRRKAMERWTPTVYLQREDQVKRLVKEQIERRQLHPAYTYEDFIGGLRLTSNGTEPTKGHLLRLVDRIRTSEKADGDLPSLPWVLILDEINRSDLTRLLGEVFSALDDRSAEIELSAAGSEAWGAFSLPDDLYVIGTMNLIDQSVEQLDFALRRRFLWLLSDFRADVIAPVVKEKWNALRLDPRHAHLRRHEWQFLARDIDLLGERAAKLNEQITASNHLGSEYRIGHTYFFDIAGFVARDPRLLAGGSHRGHYLWSSSGAPWPALLDLWDYSLAPLLEEYLAGVSGPTREKEMSGFRTAFCAPETP